MPSHIYERFTDRARRVMQISMQEAQRLNHDSVRPHHVMVGLIKEGSGVAANVLKRLGLTVENVRAAVATIDPAGPSQVRDAPKNSAITGLLVECTIAEMNALEHNYVGTEHLLLALVSYGDSDIVAILKNLGLEATAIRETALELLGKRVSTYATAKTEQREDSVEEAFCKLKSVLGNLQLTHMEALRNATVTLQELNRFLKEVSPR